MDSSQIVTMHIQSVDQNRAIKTVKRTITELDRSKIEEQKKAIRAGYDIDIIPSDLATYGRDAKALLKELQSQNERMFLVTFLVLNTGRTEQELENNVFQAQLHCPEAQLQPVPTGLPAGAGADEQPAAGRLSDRNSAGTDHQQHRHLHPRSPRRNCTSPAKRILYYGLNALSNNLIMVDRKKLKNPNGLDSWALPAPAKVSRQSVKLPMRFW